MPLGGLSESERVEALRDLSDAARALGHGDRAEAVRCLDRAHRRVEAAARPRA
ncbi:MAG: hypothetical protein ACYDFT_01265 [Thermoplasmata archaeon]